MQFEADSVWLRRLFEASVACSDWGGVIKVVDVTVADGIDAGGDDIKMVWVGVVLDAIESNESWCSISLAVFVRVDVDDEFDKVWVEFDSSEVIFIFNFYSNIFLK